VIRNRTHKKCSGIKIIKTEQVSERITNKNVAFLFVILGVGLGRVVRKVHQHPDDHEFESQQWQ
jgi:hypothetical protein